MYEPEGHSSSNFTLPLSGLLSVVSIVSSLFGMLLALSNAAWDGTPATRPLHILNDLCTANPSLFVVGFPIVVTATVSILLAVLRSILPECVRRHIPWNSPTRAALYSAPVEGIGRCLLTASLAIIGTSLLVLAAAHVSVDRTRRIPVVTWEGPLVDYLVAIAGSGWALSVAAIVLGFYTLNYPVGQLRNRFTALTVVGMILGMANLGVSFMFLVAMYED